MASVGVFFILSMIGWYILRFGLLARQVINITRDIETARAEGEIVDYVSETTKHQRREVISWYPVVRFKAGQTEHRLKSFDSYKKEDLPIGAKVKVFYAPEAPQLFHLNKGKELGSFCIRLIITGVVWILLTGALVIALHWFSARHGYSLWYTLQNCGFLKFLIKSN